MSDAPSEEGSEAAVESTLPPSLLERERTIDLDPDAFLWYGEPDADIVVGCFAFGTGAGEPVLARLGRQLAVEFAALLRLHPAFITVPQMLTVSRPGDIDTSEVRSAFAVFYSLPETRLVQQAARRIDARIALTGRLIGEGTDVHLGVNMLDVERRVLLACSQTTAPRRELVDAAVATGTYLLERFRLSKGDDDEDLESAVAEIIGTRSYDAFFNLALAEDLERTALAEGRAVDRRALVRRLGYALHHDALFARPLTRLVEIIGSTHDDTILNDIANALDRVAMRMPGPPLAHAQVLRRLGRHDEARDVLHRVVELFPECAQGYFLLGEIEAKERPRVARNHYRQAVTFDPDRALYRERLAKVEVGGAD